MMTSATSHVGQEQLVQLLWLAASCPGVSESLLHLVEECNGCYKPPSSGKVACSRHLQAADLERFGDRLFAEGSRESVDALAHLVERCAVCQKATGDLLSRIRTKLGIDWSGDDFGDLASRISRKLGSWQQRAPIEKLEAPELGRQLLSHPQARRRLLIHNSDRFSTWPLVDWLCEESRQAVIRAPKEGIDIAETAVEVAQNLDPERYGEPITADIIARSWAYLGNAHRVDEGWKEAKLAFDTSEAWLERGTRFGGTRAEVYYLRSYLASAQRSFPEAHKLLAKALEIYRDLGDTHMEGRVRVIEGHVYLTEAEPEASVEALVQASRQIDPEREPRLLLMAKHNLLLALADLGRYGEAEELLASTLELTRAIGSRIDLLRLRWTEARIDAGLGRLGRAEMTLSEVKEAFKGLDLPYDAALVGLELANLYTAQGRTREIKLLALELLPVFAKNETHREALAAVTLFARAAAAEEATVDIVERTLAALKRAAGRD